MNLPFLSVTVKMRLTSLTWTLMVSVGWSGLLAGCCAGLLRRRRLDAGGWVCWVLLGLGCGGRRERLGPELRGVGCGVVCGALAAVGCGVGAEGECGCVAAGEAVLFWDVPVCAQRGAATARQSRKREVRSPGTRLVRLRTITSNILPNRESIRANCFEERLQFDREGGVDVEGLMGLGMGEGEMGGVEEVSVELEVGSRSGMTCGAP